MFVVILIFCISIKTSDGLTCLSCQGVPVPTDCNVIARCGSHEECQQLGYLDTGPMVGRDLHVQRRDFNPCQKCCTSDLCNNDKHDKCANAVPLSTTVAPSVDGNWSVWLAWSACDAIDKLTSGLKIRTRTCSNPAPQNGGRHCAGFASRQSHWCMLQCHDPVIRGMGVVSGSWTIGGTVLLKCEASSVDGLPIVQWQAPDNTGVTDMEEGQLLVVNIQATNIGVYTCLVHNTCGQVSSDYTAVLV